MNNHLSLRTRQLMTNTRPIAKFVSFLCIILCIAPTVSAKEIDDTAIRQMLGIADRSKILTTIKYIFQGD